MDANPSQAERFTAEIGRPGLNQRDGQIKEERLSELSGQQGIQIYEEMRRNDPAVAVGLRSINWILGRVPLDVEPGGTQASDEEAAEFVEQVFDDMSYPRSKLIRDALTCLPFGWAYCEVVYKLRQGMEPADKSAAKSQYDDGKIGIRKIVLLAQTSLNKWEIDDTGGILGMHQNIPAASGGIKQVFVPIEKALLFRIDDERNNPEGQSLLRPVYQAWYAKKQLQEIEAIGVERDLTGVLIIKLPANARKVDYDKAIALLEQFRVNDMTGFVAPTFGPQEHEQWRFEIINSPGNKAINIGWVINRYNQEIARMFLVQFLMLGMDVMGSGGGSYALSRDQRDLFQVALEAILESISDTLNRYLIPPLMRLNGYDALTAYPKVKFGQIAQADIAKFSQAMVGLAQQKLLNLTKQDEDYIRSQIGLPSLPEDFEWKSPSEQNIENITEMQKSVGQIADSNARIQMPAGQRPAANPSADNSPQGQKEKARKE